MKKINKKNLSILLGFVGTLFLFTACEGFLDRKPLDEVSQASFWRTSKQLDAYIIGKYDWLPGQITDGGMGYYIADRTSDDMVRRREHYGWMNSEDNTTPASGGDWKWGPIREINMFFDNYHLCEDPFESYKQTYGEACFLKAYKYHELVIKFGDVPWYTSVISDNDEELLQKARDPRAVVVDSIMALIDKSVEHLGLRAAVGVNRLNKESALIYKSRVALFEATWAKYHKNTDFDSKVDANKYFGKAVEAYQQFKEKCGGFEGKLYSTGKPHSDYYNLFNRFNYKDVTEVALSKTYSRALGRDNNVNMFVYEYAYGEGHSYTLDLVRSYLSKDGSSINILDKLVVSSKGAAYLTDLAVKLDPRFKQSVFVPGDLINLVTVPFKDSLFAVPQMHLPNYERITSTGFSPKKAHNPEGPMVNNIDPLVSGIAFRLPELMLNYVEAYVELNGAFPDLSDNIDLLRKRVGMPTLSAVKPIVGNWWPEYGYSISDNLAIVRQERRVELAGEGYRTNDWKRWRAHNLFDGKRPKGFPYKAEDYEPYDTKPVLILDADGYVDPYFDSLSKGVFDFDESKDYLKPIPIQELMRNKNLTQNPGWATL